MGASNRLSADRGLSTLFQEKGHGIRVSLQTNTTLLNVISLTNYMLIITYIQVCLKMGNENGHIIRRKQTGQRE